MSAKGAMKEGAQKIFSNPVHKWLETGDKEREEGSPNPDS